MIDYYKDLEEIIKIRLPMSRDLAIALGLPTEKTIVIPPHIRYHGDHFDGTIEAVFTYIKNQLNDKGWDQYILFDLRDESFAVGYMRIIDAVIKPLVIDYLFPHGNIKFVVASASVAYNRKVYYKYCAQTNYLPLQVYTVNTFEAGQAAEHNQVEIFHSPEPYRKKKLLCMNKATRTHRMVLISEIMNRGLRDQTYLSFVMPKNDVITGLSGVGFFFPNLYDKVCFGINQLLDELPLNLTLEQDISNMHRLNQSDLQLFKDSLFSLVNETLFHHSVDYLTPYDLSLPVHNETIGRIHCYPSTFHTEKTWKTIRAKHPFVLASVPYTLQGLRELGYKTFHPYINETYDTIEDDETRLMAIADEVERLCKMSDDETRDWLSNVQPICKFNYDLLRKRKKMEFKRLD